MNMDKTKIMSNDHVVPIPVRVGNDTLENVDNYVYLGQIVQLGVTETMGDANEDKDKKPDKDDSKPGPSDERDKKEDKHRKKVETVPKPSHEDFIKSKHGNDDNGDIVQFKIPTNEDSLRSNAKTSDTFIVKSDDSRGLKTDSEIQRKRHNSASFQRRLNINEADINETPRERHVDEIHSDRRGLRSDSESQRKLQRRLGLDGADLDETNTDGQDSTTQRNRRQSLVGAQIEEQVLNRLSKPNIVKHSQSISSYTLDTDISDLFSQLSLSDSSFKVYPGTEHIEYDFSAERRNLYTTNIIESIAHLIKGCLGVGILSIHEAWMRGGMWASLGAMIFIGFLAPYTMNLLVLSAQKLYVRMRIPKLSFPDLAEASFATAPAKCIRRYSKLFRYLVDITIVSMQCCSCSLYQLASANTLKKIVEGISSAAKEAEISVRVYVLIITAPLIFLCLIRKFRYLSLISMVADIVIGVCIITALYYSIKAGGNLLERPAWKSSQGFFNFCGVCLYGVDGIALALPVENNMRYPRLFTFTLQVAMGVSVLGVAFVGFFGYWGWGEDCKTPITLHIKENTVTTIMEMLLIAMLLITFAVQFWVPFRILWRYIGKRLKRKRGHWENFFRMLNLVVITIISVAFPNMNTVMGILGDVIVSTVALIFPPLIETLVTWKEYRKGWIRWILVKNLCIIMCGLSLIVGALVTNI